jgi:tRNA uridine 5-carbamoylmethylation protein Kti12
MGNKRYMSMFCDERDLLDIAVDLDKKVSQLKEERHVFVNIINKASEVMKKLICLIKVVSCY